MLTIRSNTCLQQEPSFLPLIFNKVIHDITEGQSISIGFESIKVDGSTLLSYISCTLCGGLHLGDVSQSRRVFSTRLNCTVLSPHQIPNVPIYIPVDGKDADLIDSRLAEKVW